MCWAAPSTAPMDTFTGALLGVKESAIIIWKLTIPGYNWLIANWFGVSSQYCGSVELGVCIAVVLYNRTSLPPWGLNRISQWQLQSTVGITDKKHTAILCWETSVYVQKRLLPLAILKSIWLPWKIGHPKTSMIPSTLKGLNFLLWLQEGELCSEAPMALRFFHSFWGSGLTFYSLQLKDLFAGHLGGRKGPVIPIWVAAERNAFLQDRQMFLLGFCAVQKYLQTLPTMSAACCSSQNCFKSRRNCVAGRGGLASVQFHRLHWTALENAVTAPADWLLNALCLSSYQEDT